ncbi:class I SAM-dependent methyltransferase [Endothiovibrio diazotrophicus]
MAEFSGDGVDRLPLPDTEAAAHSGRVVGRIREEIEGAGGAIPFVRFMELALYAPGLGYYTAGARKFGEAGDFVTAPELSPLFGRALARQCAEVLERLGGGDLLEIGAGSGALAVDLLGELALLGQVPGRYRILERSADLRRRQQALLGERLPGLVERVEWLDRLPEGFSGVVVANELLDAFAVHRFHIAAEGLREWGVAWADGRFHWCLLDPAPELVSAVAAIEAERGEPLPVGYDSEVCLTLGPWFAALGEALARGMALFVDYGYPRREYYLTERGGGTLLCHFRHRVHGDPFLLPGLQDITASVDFSAVAEAAFAAGLRVAGYTSQALLLLGCGLDELLAVERDDDTPRVRTELARQAKLLTLPGEMGERFQAIALTRGVEGPWRGFAFGDRRGSL